MNTPARAMLWEIWRVTRTEALWKFSLGTIVALGALAWAATFAPPDEPSKVRAFGAAIALAAIVMPFFLGWMFLQRFNGHRPGFPLPLLFTRPLRTSLMVVLSLAYLSLLPAAAYLLSALLLRAVSGHPFPLLPVAAWITVLNLVMTATSWSVNRTSSVTLATMVFSGAWMILASVRLAGWPEGSDWHDSPAFWPVIFDFPLTDYAWIAGISLVAVAITVAKVARQRRGDALAKPSKIWNPGAGYPEGLVNLFRFRCPTSSATRAQIWFELKSRGFPALAIGLTIAAAIPLLFTISVALDAVITEWFRPYLSCSNRGCFYARGMVVFFCGFSLAFMFFQGGNAFGIRWKQGRVYLSPFEATKPRASASLALIKLLVRAACFLVALSVVALSAWLSVPILGDGVFLQIVEVPLSSLQPAFHAAAATLDGLDKLAIAVVVIVGALAWSATFAVTGALWIRHPRTGNIMASLLLTGVLLLALLALAERMGAMPAFLVDAIFVASRWLAVATMTLTIVYVFWRGLAERVLSLYYAGGALLVSAAFAAAWVTASRLASEKLAGAPAPVEAAMVWPALLVLMITVLVPWSFNRLRHM